MASPQGSIVKREKTVPQTLRGMLVKRRREIETALPKHVNFDRFMRVVVTAVQRDPKLAECSYSSLILSTYASAALGLEPNTPLGHAYLIPFWNSKKGVSEAQFMTGYRGFIDLARRTGDIDIFYAERVCENDEFVYERGTDPKLVHKPRLSDRGDSIAYYSVFRTKTGAYDFEVMTVDEIDEIRNRSKSGNRGPWVSDYDEMAKKTVIRRLAKRAPMSLEIAIASDLDNRASMGEAQENMDDYFDIEPTSVDDADDMQENAASRRAPQDEPGEQEVDQAPPPAPAPKRQTKQAANAGPVESPPAKPKAKPPEQPAPEEAEPPEQPELRPDVFDLISTLAEKNISAEAAIEQLQNMKNPWLTGSQTLSDLDESKVAMLMTQMSAFVEAINARK